MARIGREGRRYEDVRSFIGELYGPDLHAKRVGSLAGATLGTMTAASLAVALIGQALAQARGLKTKHAIKQVDRLLSNDGIDVWDSFARWVPHQIGERRDILVAMDWTDFDDDDQATLVLSLVTGHGRAAPLLWLTVWKEELKNQRNDYEDACLRRLSELVPPGCRVTILADRGFGDQKLFAYLGRLGFDYVIRFRGNIHVTDADGQTKPAAEWVGKGGRARKLRDARVTAKGQQVGAVVCVHAKGMKEPWCLATSLREATAATLVNHYAKRWTIDIDQAWRLSRIKGWVGSICNEAFWVGHRGSVFSSARIRAADRQSIADQQGRATPARRRGVRRARCPRDWRADCRATPDIGRGSP
jgi:hypothetical protein